MWREDCADRAGDAPEPVAAGHAGPKVPAPPHAVLVVGGCRRHPAERREVAIEVVPHREVDQPVRLGEHPGVEVAAAEVLGGEAGEHGAIGLAGGQLAVNPGVIGVAHALAVRALPSARAQPVPVAAGRGAIRCRTQPSALVTHACPIITLAVATAGVMDASVVGGLMALIMSETTCSDAGS